MARQIGKHQISGTLGNLTFYKSKYGMLVRKKTSLDAKRVAKDPCFKGTRENAGEFKKAIRAGQVLRTALHPVLTDIADNAVTGRMNGLFLKILRQDETHVRGERMVSAGQIGLAEGFDFNRDALLRETLRIAYKTSIDYTTGQMQVTIPAFIPGQDINFPEGATQCRFVMAGTAVDFDKETFSKAYQMSEYVALGEAQKACAAITLACGIECNIGQALFQTLGVMFYRIDKGARIQVANGAMAVVGVGKVEKKSCTQKLCIPKKKKQVYRDIKTNVNYTTPSTILTGSIFQSSANRSRGKRLTLERCGF